ALEINNGEFLALGIAAQHGMIMAGGNSYGLRPEIILVRPKPRRRRIFGGIASNNICHDIRHVIRILDRFQPNEIAIDEPVQVRRAITDREYIRQRSKTLPVHLDAVGTFSASSCERFNTRTDPDAYDD